MSCWSIITTSFMRKNKTTEPLPRMIDPPSAQDIENHVPPPNNCSRNLALRADVPVGRHRPDADSTASEATAASFRRASAVIGMREVTGRSGSSAATSAGTASSTSSTGDVARTQSQTPSDVTREADDLDVGLAVVVADGEPCPDGVPTGFGSRLNLRMKAWLTTATRGVPTVSEPEMDRPASSMGLAGSWAAGAVLVDGDEPARFDQVNDGARRHLHGRPARPAARPKVPTTFVQKYTPRAQLKPSGAREPASGRGRPAAAGDPRGSVRNKWAF